MFGLELTFSRYHWASLQVRLILDQTHLSGIRGALNSVPSDISGIVACALRTVSLQHENRKELANRTLALLTAVEAPLTAEAICHALGLAHVLDKENPSKLSKDVVPDPKSMIECCMGLIKIEPTTKVVTLAHHDILQEMRKRWVHLFAPKHTARLARVCIAYLSFFEFSKGPCHEIDALKTRLENYPFLAYASRYWGYHAREALSLGTPEADVSDDIYRLLRQPMNLGSSLQVYESEQAGKQESSVVHADKFLGVSKLQIAARHGLITIVETVIRNNPNMISKQDPYGRTALHEAARAGWNDVLNGLLKAGAIPSLEDYQGKTSFDYAAEHGQGKIISILEEHSYCCQTQQVIPSGIRSTRSRHYQKKLEEALYDAAEIGKPDIVQELLKLDVNPHAGKDGISAVAVATSRGHERIVRMLLDASDSLPNLEGSPNDSIPLHQAIRNGHVNIAALLLDYGTSIQTRDDSGRTALFEALSTPDVRGAALLLKNGIDISCHDFMGDTVLHEAARRGTFEHTLLFINQGIEIVVANKEGLTPLHLAARHGCYEVANLLIRKGSGVSLRGSKGQTPLMYAASAGHTQLCDMLLRLGAT